jgi:hypothetical protein
MSVTSYSVDRVADAIDRLAKAHEANAKATIIAARIAANTEARSHGVYNQRDLPYPTPEDVRTP